MVFKKKYALLTLIVLIVEICIAIYHFYPFLRGFLGDVLVIILLYTFLKTFFVIKDKKLIGGILLFAFLIEILQFFKLTELLHIESKILKIILGSTFDVWDLFAYLLGGFAISIFQNKRKKLQN